MDGQEATPASPGEQIDAVVGGPPYQDVSKTKRDYAFDPLGNIDAPRLLTIPAGTPIDQLCGPVGLYLDDVKQMISIAVDMTSEEGDLRLAGLLHGAGILNDLAIAQLTAARVIS